MTLYYYEQAFDIEPIYYANFAIVMATLLAADLCSWTVGENRSGSIRELPAHPAVRFFFSYMQFGATTGCLYGFSRRLSVQMLYVLVLQTTPFLMTLRRKNLLS